MINTNKYNSLILNLSLDELDSISSDIELYFSKYTFYYAIDAYDFIHFFIPYLDKIKFTKENLNVLAQEAIAYESLFSESQTGNILLLDEYKSELLIVRDIFLEKLKNALEYTKNVKNLSSEIDSLIKSNKDLSTIVKENFELFFLLLILSQRKVDIKEVDFLKFLKKKLLYSYFETDNEELNIIADMAFSKEKSNTFVDRVYDAFIDSGIEYIEKISPKNRFKYLNNTYIDIEAIERVLNANEIISASKTFNNTVFYYLSSAPVKSRLIFNTIHENFRHEFSFNENLKLSRNSIHRNIIQVFLLNILIKEYDEKSMALRIIELLKKVKNQELGAESSTSEENDIAEIALNELLLKYSSNIENHFYTRFLDNYKDTLQSITEGITENVDFLQKRLLDNFSSYIDEQENEEETKNFKYNVSKYGQLLLLKRAISKKSKELKKVKIKFGEDIIRFSFHHLPFLLFLNDRKSHQKHDSFYLAMQIISEIEIEDEIYTESIIQFLEDLYNEKSRNLDQKIFEFLILIFIDLLSINISGTQLSQSFELELIYTLERQLKILDKLVPANKKGTIQNEHSLKLEIYYVLTWLYRRNLKFDLIQSIEAIVLNEGSNDARILHGLGISYIANFYYLKRNINYKDLVSKAIDYLIKSQGLYLVSLNKVFSRNLANLIYRSLIGVCNTLSDSYIRLYEVEKNKACLISSRTYISKVKEYCEKIQINYDELTVPNNTESELEYYEAEILVGNKEYEMGRLKLRFAQKRFEKSIAKKSEMDHVFLEVKDKIEALKDQIKRSHSTN